MQQDETLLDLVCRRLKEVGAPACIKDSELRYVAASLPYCAALGLDLSSIIGKTDAELAEQVFSARRDEAERRAIVFGQDGEVEILAPGDSQYYFASIEQFVSDDGDIFVYEQLKLSHWSNPVPDTEEATQWRIDAINAAFEELGQSTLSQAVDISLGAESLPEAPAEPEAFEDEKPSPVFSGYDVRQAAASDILKAAIDDLDAGIVIIDPNDVVVYANSELERMYMPHIGLVRQGERLVDILRRAASRELTTELGSWSQEQRDAWVDARMQNYWAPQFNEVMVTSGGRWIHVINRRLANGYMVGLRFEVTEYKEREGLLMHQREQGGLFKAILDALPVPVYARDEQHLLIYNNRSSLALEGVEESHYLGLDERAVFGDAADEIVANNEHVLQTGEVSIQETVFPGCDGEIPLLSMVSRADLPDGGKYLVGTYTDITILKDRERDIDTARQTLLDILNNLSTGVLVIRQEDLVIELANDVILKFWETSPFDGVVGHDARALIEYSLIRNAAPADSEKRRKEAADWIDCITRGELPEREIISSAGRTYLVRGHAIGQGLFVLTYNDITELRLRGREAGEARSKLANTDRLMHDALVSMSQGMLILSGDRIEICNDAVSRLLDLAPGLARSGAAWSELWKHCTARCDFGSGADAFLNDILVRWNAGELIDINFCVGGARWIRLEAKPTGGQGRVVLLTDVTDLRNRQDELEKLLVRAEKADSAKSEFLASVGHEIRTPMNGVMSMVELLSHSNLDSRQRTFVDAIGKSSNALLTIMNDIIEISQIDSGNLELKTQVFNPAEAVDDVITLFASKAEEKNIRLFAHHNTSVPTRIRASAVQFRQMLANIVSNALKFTEEGHVEISLAAEEGAEGRTMLSVSVRDTGIGIPKGRLKTIFDKFSSVEGLSSDRYQGLGLGLAKTRGIARLLRGDVSVTSEPGRGSTFTISIPVEVVSNAAASVDQTQIGAGGRILVIDADPTMRNSTISILSREFDVSGAESAEQSLAIMRAAAMAGLAIDATILSSTLGEPQVRSLIKALKADYGFASIPLILLTSPRPEENRKFADLEVTAHLHLPVRTSLLRNTISEILINSRMPKVSAPIPAQQHVAQSPVQPEYASEIPLEVLVAEDNEVNIMVYEQALSSIGCRFQIVRDGSEAVRVWRERRPTVVIMDISMPVQDGLSATADIRAEEARLGIPRTPIIGVTAHSLDADRMACLDAGMDDYMAKPISPDRLTTKIDSWTAIATGHRAIAEAISA